MIARLRLTLLALLLVLTVLMAIRSCRSREAAEAPPPAGPDSASVGMRAALLWFASPTGDSLVTEARELPDQADAHTRVAALVAALDQGPREAGVRTLPQGTLVLHVFLDESGLLTLDLSRQFRQGFLGGARAEELAVGSLVRTLAANVPEAKHIRIVCAGVALSSLGGHFPLDQPLDPEDWP